MGSRKDPTITAETAPVQTNTVSFGDLPAHNVSDAVDLAITVPLIAIDEMVWASTIRGAQIQVVRPRPLRVEILRDSTYLGLVPPQYVETVIERQLVAGDVQRTGNIPSELRVRLRP